MATSILSPAQIQAVQDAIRKTEAAKALCQKGAACGFDLEGDHAVAHATGQRLAEVLRQFAPKTISEA